MTQGIFDGQETVQYELHSGWPITLIAENATKMMILISSDRHFTVNMITG